jgi:hypothetical protein
MKWQLEELTEDALVSYLQSVCGGLRISASWERDGRNLATTIAGEVIAEPVTGS